MSQKINKIRDILKKQQIDAALITSVPNIIYFTNYANFSTEEREAFLLITHDSQYILTDGRYTTAVKEQIKNFQLIELSSGKPLKETLKSLIEKHTITSLGIEDQNVTVAEFNRIKPLVPSLKSLAIYDLRWIKDAEEIQAIEKACKIGDEAFAFILKEIKPGLTEKDIAVKLEHFIKNKHADLSFPSIVAFGSNAAIPHHQTGDKKLSQNELILLDFGVKYKNYCSDMTRTVFIGKPTAKQKHIYNTVLEAQQAAITYLNSQLSTLNTNKTRMLSAAEVDKIARDHIVSQGYPAIPHSLGHGIGLQVHEPPTLSPISKQTLTEGMVFSIEPGIYLPNNAGVRIEDLFVIEKKNIRQLTQSPREIILI